MRFSCDSCNAKYSISDEKVRGKILRIRCKKCKNIIEVREPRPEGAPAATFAEAHRPATGGHAARPASLNDAPRPASRAQARSRGAPRPATGAGAHSSTGTESLSNELDEVFGQGTADSLSGDNDKTVLFDYSEKMLGVRSSEDSDPGEGSDISFDPQLGTPQVFDEWYLAVDGKQTGPLPEAEIRATLQASESLDRTFAWRDGMTDWAKVTEVPELRAFLPAGDPPALEASEVSAAIVAGPASDSSVAEPAAKGNGGSTPSSLADDPSLFEAAESVTDEDVKPPQEPAPAVIEATMSSSEGGAVVTDEKKPAGAVQSPASGDPSPSPLDLGIEELSSKDAGVGAEPIQIGPRGGGEAGIPSAAAIESVEQPKKRRTSALRIVLLLLLLAIGVVLLLGALDIVYIPFISTEPAKEVPRSGKSRPSAGSGQILKRDPLLDRATTQIRIRPVQPLAATDKSKTARSKRKRAAGRSAAAARKKVAGIPTTSVRRTEAPIETSPEPSGPSKLEQRVYGGGIGVKAPKLPEHLRARTTVEVASNQGLSQSIISGVIRRYRSGIQNCYQKQLKTDSSVGGRLTLNLRIAKTGRVVKAGVPGTKGKTVVAKCVVRVAQTWRFPPSKTEIDVDYPLILERPY